MKIKLHHHCHQLQSNINNLNNNRNLKFNHLVIKLGPVNIWKMQIKLHHIQHCGHWCPGDLSAPTALTKYALDLTSFIENYYISEEQRCDPIKAYMHKTGLSLIQVMIFFVCSAPNPYLNKSKPVSSWPRKGQLEYISNKTIHFSLSKMYLEMLPAKC